MNEVKCTEFCEANYDFDEHVTPCKCPVCGGWLAWRGDKPVCNRCQTELLVIPKKEESEDDDEISYGKICPISRPKRNWKLEEAKKRVDVKKRKELDSYGYPVQGRVGA